MDSVTSFELLFNAIFGIIAGIAAIFTVTYGVKQWKHHPDSVTGAVFIAIAALCLCVGACAVASSFFTIAQLHAH